MYNGPYNSLKQFSKRKQKELKAYTVNIYRYKAIGANATSSVISTTWKCISFVPINIYSEIKAKICYKFRYNQVPDGNDRYNTSYTYQK